MLFIWNYTLSIPLTMCVCMIQTIVVHFKYIRSSLVIWITFLSIDFISYLLFTGFSQFQFGPNKCFQYVIYANSRFKFFVNAYPFFSSWVKTRDVCILFVVKITEQSKPSELFRSIISCHITTCLQYKTETAWCIC